MDRTKQLTKFLHSELPYPRQRDSNGHTTELREFLRRKYHRWVCPAFQLGVERQRKNKDGKVIGTYVDECFCGDCKFDRIWCAPWERADGNGSLTLFPRLTAPVAADGNRWVRQNGSILDTLD